MRVLVPVDGSECALHAAEFAARNLGSAPEIHLLTVRPPIPYPRAVAVIGQERVQEYYEDEGRAALRDARELLDREGRTYTAGIRLGDPARTIADYAAEAAVDLIVMGTRGRGGIAGLVMGSVAMKVVHLAKAPVVLVK